MSTDHTQSTIQSTNGLANVTMAAVTSTYQPLQGSSICSSSHGSSYDSSGSAAAAAAASPVSDKSIPKPPRGHRRQQASIGLGIITTSLDITPHKIDHATGEPSSLQGQQPEDSKQHKNDVFFSTTGLQLPRPPPPLSTHRERQSPPTISSFPPRRTLAPPPSVPSPIPNTYTASRSYSNDDIMPLPSPAPNNPSTSVASDVAAVVAAAAVAVAASTCVSSATSSSSSSASVTMPIVVADAAAKLFPKQRVMSPHQLSPVTPDEETTDIEQSQPLHERIIPAIVVSPTLPPEKKNKLPSLVDEPRLGDPEDKNSTSRPSTGLDLPMMCGYKFPSPSPIQYTEENIVGKQIGEYRIRRMVGVGAFSKVYLATKKRTPYAIKMVSKKRISEDARVRSSLEREVGLLKFIDHPSIVGLDATMETEKHLCIVLEFAGGGELFDFVQRMHQQLQSESKKVNEGLVRRIFVELVRVVQWLHEHNVVHRDLKLENILIRMDDDTTEPHLKVTDFGLARVIDPEAPTLTTRCGSEEYCAPEIVQGLGYDGRKTDTWALGVILYALLVGYLPFMYNPSRGEKVSHLFYRIISSDYRWPLSWQQQPELAVSQQARHVVDRMLQRSPDKRIALSDIETMDWFTSAAYTMEKIS